jgi:hypothetical protein
MTRPGSQGYVARLASETNTTGDVLGESGVAAGTPSGVSGTTA